ncbi:MULTISPECIES: hypothetical protein [unclassified Pseudoalteromonas]|uniref:hypothetical protein n=1 Tax=unclassified Pseudoalteromonas TaxID=194690 RepID=UPI0020983A5C|nr:hypothetical protein [Pseudoalteromonas sp. XMcav2-N]MCO7189086.1 hypothetical protein [Pseudoalteromonas sp. XMcav2-N]
MKENNKPRVLAHTFSRQLKKDEASQVAGGIRMRETGTTNGKGDRFGSGDDVIWE